MARLDEVSTDCSAQPATLTGAGPHPSNDREPSAFVSSRHLAALSEISQVLVTAHEFEDAIEQVIATVARALSIESGGILLLDKEAAELVLQLPAFGMWSDQPVGPTRIPLSSFGNSVHVFNTGRPYMSNDARNDPRILQNFVDAYKTRSILTVPLQIAGRSIGVFHGVNKLTGSFDKEDLDFLSLIAPHLAIIVRSAEMMRTLRAQHKQLESVLEIETTLSRAFLADYHLAGLTKTLAELLRAPVLLTDDCGQLLTSAANGEVICDDLIGELTAALVSPVSRTGTSTGSDHAPVCLAHITGLRQAAGFPVIVRGDRLGFLVALGIEAELSDMQLRALRQAVTLFAVEMTKDNEVYEIERRLQVDVLDRLFATTSEPEAIGLLRRIGVRAHASSLRAGFMRLYRQHAGPSAHRHGAYEARLHRLFHKQLHATYEAAAVVPYRDGFFFLFPSAPDRDARHESECLAGIFNALDGVGAGQQVDFHAGVGSAVQTATDVAKSFEQALAVVDMIEGLGCRNTVVLIEELDVYRLLVSPARDRDLAEFAHEVLGSLLAYDQQHGTDWMEFLRALVEANFGVGAVSRSLEMHLNTAKYRKRRIEELIGRDLDAAETRFDVHLALKILTVQAALARRLTRTRPGGTDTRE